MTVDLDHIVNKTQDAYGVPEPVVRTYVGGGVELHQSMPERVRDQASIEQAPLRWMNTLYTAHDHIDGVLQPLVNSLHDTHGEKQTLIRTFDMYRDAELQANYGTICEIGVPEDIDAARQQVKNTVKSIQPVLIAGAYSPQFDNIPVHVGHLENQTFQRFKEALEDDAAEEAKMRSQLTEATNISKVKRGTLISPQHFYLHQVEGNGSLEKGQVQKRLADYFTLQMPSADDADEAYEQLRSQLDPDADPYVSYVFEAFEDITGTSPIDPARSIDW